MSLPQDERRTVPLSDGLLDRLVDGELDESARGAVLARLEAEPGGWRRCALAFLEAQAWREALSAVPQEGRLTGPIPTERIVPMPRGCGRASGLRGRAALAAAVLAAFTAGWLASTTLRGGSPAPLDAPRLADDHRPHPAEHPGNRQAAGAEDRGTPGHTMTPVSFVNSAPVADDTEEELGLSRPEREQLEQRGYRLERRRSVMSVDLDDGDTVSLPVDSVEIRYVGHQVY